MLKFCLLDLEGVCETYFVYVEYTQMVKVIMMHNIKQIS